jgi:hypothetical protein
LSINYLGSAVFAHHLIIKNPMILGISKTKKCAFVVLPLFGVGLDWIGLGWVGLGWVGKKNSLRFFFGGQLKRPTTGELNHLLF